MAVGRRVGGGDDERDMAALVALLGFVLLVTGEPPAPCRPGAAPPWARETRTTGGWRRLAVLVRIDTQALERHVNVADVILEIRAPWKPYADIDFADIVAPVERGYDDELRLAVDERTPSSATTARPLGWITFTAPEQPADLITVSVGEARQLMNEGRWGDLRIAQLPTATRQQFMTRSIARSAAHEIGHYLLRSRAHTRTGLMRTRLTVDDIMDTDLRAFKLDASQIDALRRRTPVTGLAVNGVMPPAGTE